MPLLQHLLSRLMDCRPTGGAVHDPVVHVRCMEQHDDSVVLDAMPADAVLVIV